eukprot:scaffold843_cov255-Pinguiococcus_pyrenoidosus.AAC.4
MRDDEGLDTLSSVHADHENLLGFEHTPSANNIALLSPPLTLVATPLPPLGTITADPRRSGIPHLRPLHRVEIALVDHRRNLCPAAGRAVPECGIVISDLGTLHDARAADRLRRDPLAAGADRTVAEGGVVARAHFAALHDARAARVEPRGQGSVGALLHELLLRVGTHVLVGSLHSDEGPREAGHGLLDGPAQGVDAVHHDAEVLQFVEVDGLEEIVLRDAERAAVSQEDADVLHLLERQLGGVDDPDGARLDGVDQLAQDAAVLKRLPEASGEGLSGDGFDPFLDLGL